MDYVQLGKVRVPLERSYRFSLAGDSTLVAQEDYTNAILHVNVPPEHRQAISKIIVNEGEHQLDHWEVGNSGAYTGAWAKRFAKYVYKEHNVKLDPRIVSIISERVMKALNGLRLDIRFEFSTKLWNPGEFGEAANSCWFGSKLYGYSSQGIINSGQGGAIKIYTPDGFKRGRCWFYNVDDSILIFNAYDLEKKLDILSIARMVSNYFHLQYHRHTDVIVNASYLNGNAIYAIGDPPITRTVSLDFALLASHNIPTFASTPVFDIPGNFSCCICSGEASITWKDNKRYCKGHSYRCIRCAEETPTPYLKITDDKGDFICDDCIKTGGGWVCSECEHYCEGDICQNCNPTHVCAICEEAIQTDDAYEFEGNPDLHVCNDCYDTCTFTCHECGNLYHEDDSNSIQDGDYSVCNDCFALNYGTCEYCETSYRDNRITECHGTTMCDDCANDRTCVCERCNEREWNDDCHIVERADGSEETWCENCYGNETSYCDECDVTYADSDGHECPELEEDEEP